MRFSVATILKAATLPRSLRNRVFNAVASMLTGRKLALDWSDLKIVHPEAIHIGHDFSAGRGLWLESVDGRGEIRIGNHVNVSDWVHIGCAQLVSIEDGVLIGSKTLITDHSHGGGAESLASEIGIDPNRRAIQSKGPIIIRRRVWIGDGACILPGVEIGEGAIVGANSVVTRNIPAATIWAGAPARQIWPRNA